jgi:hypothetical protein
MFLVSSLAYLTSCSIHCLVIDGHNGGHQRVHNEHKKRPVPNVYEPLPLAGLGLTKGHQAIGHPGGQIQGKDYSVDDVSQSYVPLKD